jgi:hypothetical protein
VSGVGAAAGGGAGAAAAGAGGPDGAGGAPAVPAVQKAAPARRPLTPLTPLDTPVFPDVAKTPSPSGPVPLPYPNTPLENRAGSAPTAKNPQTLPVLKQGSMYIRSTGDEAGTLKGAMPMHALPPAPPAAIPPALPAVQQPVQVERAARQPVILQTSPMLQRRP